MCRNTAACLDDALTGLACLYVYMYICIHTYIHIYMHIYTYLHTHIYIYIYIYMRVCVCNPSVIVKQSRVVRSL